LSTFPIIRPEAGLLNKSSSFRCYLMHICHRCEFGSHLVVRLKSDLDVRQTHLRLAWLTGYEHSSLFCLFVGEKKFYEIDIEFHLTNFSYKKPFFMHGRLKFFFSVFKTVFPFLQTLRFIYTADFEVHI
jgi:hypothetical protein